MSITEDDKTESQPFGTRDISEDVDGKLRLEFLCGVTGALVAAHVVCCALFAALIVIDIFVK